MDKRLEELADQARSAPAERAIALWSEILNLDATDAEALYSRACCFAETGEAVAALADVDRLRSVSDDLATRLARELELSAGPYCDIGFASLDSGYFEDAERSFQIAKCNSPELTDAHIGLGRVYLETNHFEKCEESFKAALHWERDNVYALMGLGDLELARGRPNKAIEWYSAVLDQQDESYCYQQRADAYEALGMVQEAASDREKAAATMDNREDDNSLEDE